MALLPQIFYKMTNTLSIIDSQRIYVDINSMLSQPLNKDGSRHDAGIPNQMMIALCHIDTMDERERYGRTQYASIPDYDYHLLLAGVCCIVLFTMAGTVNIEVTPMAM